MVNMVNMVSIVNTYKYVNNSWCVVTLTSRTDGHTDRQTLVAFASCARVRFACT
jgi:hypothetical protein